MNFMDWLFGHSPEMQQASTLNQGQQGLQNQLTGGMGQPSGSALNYLQQILSNDPEAFKAFADQAKMQFEQETVPGIAERFAGMGTAGAQDSSAFQQTLGRAGTEMTTQLEALKQGLKGNAIQQLQGLMGGAFKPSFENVYDPGSYGAVGGLMQGVGQGVGSAIGGGGLGALFNSFGGGGNQGFSSQRGQNQNPYNFNQQMYSL